jgi:diguanylate cyclase (GGDEF)-like protein/putative nucleotidyltransferase with HDIG domain
VKKLNFSEFNTQAKIIWFALVISSVAVLLYSSFGLLSFSLGQFGFLVVTSLVFFVLSQMQIKVPGTKLIFWFKEEAVFLAAIWFGVTGAVILAAIATVAYWKLIHIDKKSRVFVLAVNICTAFAATEVFYACLKVFAGFEGNAVAENDVEIISLISASVLMCLVYYVANTFLFSVFFSLSSAATFFSVLTTHFQLRFISYVGGLLLAFMTYLCLANFGISFGFVFVPISIISYLTYYFQAQTLSQKTKEIREAGRIHLATVEALATAIDARDQIGEGHIRRVQVIAGGMGEVLGLDEGEMQALRMGALLHDIGKLGIPDHILNKSGQLTPAETEKMKIHPTIGAAILEKVDFNYPVVATVRHHHENWDGTGYPSKLKGEKIPLTARVLSIADAYDSLRGERIYRKAVSRENARKIMLDNAGTKFDPKLVDVFMRNLHNFEAELADREIDYPTVEITEGEPVITSESPTGNLKQGYVEQIKNANKEVFTLYELARVFSTSLSLQQTLELFTKKLGELIPFDSCVVYILDESNRFATAMHVEGENTFAIIGKQIFIDQGATGSVLKHQLPVYQISPILDFAFYENNLVADYLSMASLPLLAENRLIGAVSLYSAELDNYEAEHMRMLETISKIAADAISKSISHAATENRSLTDPMTSLPNARSLQTQFEKEVARAYRSRNEFQVLMIDLDGFKKVNDTFGHKTGDAVLREVSKVMRSQLREYDFLARYAGDEFVAILPETTNAEIQELIQRIEHAVKHFALPVEGDRFAQVGVSIGAATYPKNGETLDAVLIAADVAMYSTKALHKQKEEDAKPKPKPILIENNMLIVELDESHIISNSIN